MSQVMKELLEGPPGVAIRDALLTLIGQLEEATQQAARDDSKSFGDIRYRAGCADGVRFALTNVMDLGKNT